MLRHVEHIHFEHIADAWQTKSRFQQIFGNGLKYVGNKMISNGTGGGDRTRTPKGQQILSLSRLPFRHSGIE